MASNYALLVVGIVVAATLGTGAVAAQEDQRSDDRLVENLDALANTYNQNLEQVPGVFRDQLANERVEVVVESDDGANHYAANTGDGARVTAIERGEAENPTVRVTTDAETLEEIRTADDPASTAVDAYDSGEIKISGVGVVNAVKVTVVEAAVSVGRTLGLI